MSIIRIFITFEAKDFNSVFSNKNRNRNPWTKYLFLGILFMSIIILVYIIYLSKKLMRKIEKDKD